MLIEKFSKNPRMIEKTVWQDEKDFPLHVPVNCQNDRVYYRGRKSDVPDANLNKETKRLSKKVMVSPLDYFFWDLVKSKVYAGQKGKPFKDEKELQAKIKSVWRECATDLAPIQKAIKQFVPRLQAVKDKAGYSTKMIFG